MAIAGPAKRSAKLQPTTVGCPDGISLSAKLGGRVDVAPRLFLRELVDVFDRVQQYGDYDPMEQYEFDVEAVKCKPRSKWEAVLEAAEKGGTR